MPSSNNGRVTRMSDWRLIEPKTARSSGIATQLFGRAHEVGIRHEGHLYRLRRTKLGKLILTK